MKTDISMSLVTLDKFIAMLLQKNTADNQSWLLHYIIICHFWTVKYPRMLHERKPVLEPHVQLSVDVLAAPQQWHFNCVYTLVLFQVQVDGVVSCRSWSENSPRGDRLSLRVLFGSWLYL